MSEEQPTATCKCGYPVESGEHSLDCPNNKIKNDETGEGSKFKQKDKKQLKDQYRQSTLYSSNFDYQSETLPYPDEALFGLSKTQLDEKLQQDPDLKQQYLEYIKHLLNLRKEMKKRMTSDAPMTEQVPEFLYRNFFDRVKGTRDSYSEKFISDSEIEEASKSNESFIKLVGTRMHERPNFFLHNVDQLTSLFDQDTIKKIAKYAAEKNPSMFLIKLPELHRIFDAEELAEIIGDIAKYESPHSLKEVLNIKEVRDRLPKELVREITLNAGKNYFLENVQELVNEGIISKEDARETFFASISNARKVFDGYKGETIKSYLDLCDDDESREKVRTIIEGKIEKGDFSDFNFSEVDKMIEHYSHILGPDFVRKLINSMVEHGDMNIMKYPEIVIANAGEEGFDKLLDHFIENFTIRQQFEVGYLLNNELVPDKKKKEILDRLPEISPYLIYLYSGLAMQFMEEDEKSDFIKRVMTEYPQSVEHPAQDMEYLTDMTDEEKKEFIKGLARADNSLDVLRTYNGLESNPNTKILHEAVSREEMKSIIMEKVLMDPAWTLSRLEQIAIFFGDEKELKKFILDFSKVAPHYTISYFKSFADLFDSDERESFLNELIKKSPNDAISSFDNWSGLVSEDFARSFIKKSIKEHPDVTLEVFDLWIRYFDNKEVILKELIPKNPFIAALYVEKFQRFLPGITTENIIDNATTDQEMLQYAPKKLTSLLKRFQQTKSPEHQEAIAKQGFRVYWAINEINAYGVGPAVLQILESGNFNEKDEMEIIESFYGFALLKKNGIIDDNEPAPQSKEELDKLLSEGVAKFLSSESLTPQEKSLAIEKFGGAAPILLYAGKHIGSEQIMSLLKNVYENAGRGNYKRWRFETDRDLEELKLEGKLPNNLTSEQYQKWTEDSSSDSLETLSSSAEDISQNVRSIIFTNLNELGMEGLVDSDPALEIENIKLELTQIGQEISRLGSNLAHANESEREKLKLQIDELKEARNERVKFRNFLRLMTLRGKEIAQGYLLEGSDDKRSQKISKFLDQLTKDHPEMDKMVNNIKKTLGELGAGDQAAQVLEASDVSDLETCFKIGSNPVNSCQDYAGGGMNEALLGYVAEANTKISVIRNEKGNILARRVLRLLELPDGQPALFLEQKYSSTASGAIDKVMLDQIMKKAETMNVRLFVKGEDQVPDGFTLTKSKEKLESKGGRAPYVYVDAAGGEKKSGKFKITELFELTRSST